MSECPQDITTLSITVAALVVSEILALIKASPAKGIIHAIAVGIQAARGM